MGWILKITCEIRYFHIDNSDARTERHASSYHLTVKIFSLLLAYAWRRRIANFTSLTSNCIKTSQCIVWDDGRDTNSVRRFDTETWKKHVQLTCKYCKQNSHVSFVIIIRLENAFNFKKIRRQFVLLVCIVFNGISVQEWCVIMRAIRYGIRCSPCLALRGGS
jgi:hypothetical protein